MTRVVCDAGRVVVVRKPHGITSEDAAKSLGLKLVHRIDKPTSGLFIVARDARTVTRLQRALREGKVERVYRFIARGDVQDGVRESFLVRDRGDGKRGSAPGQPLAGKRAVAEIFGCTRAVGLTMGFARLVTGRTHQLRIQLAEEGHPIVGERVYANDAHERLLLHAERLRFVHPDTKDVLDVYDEADFSWSTMQTGTRAP